MGEAAKWKEKLAEAEAHRIENDAILYWNKKALKAEAALESEKKYAKEQAELMQQTYLDECNAHADISTQYKKSRKLNNEILKPYSKIKTDYEETKKEKEEQYHELIAARKLNEEKQKLLFKIKNEY